MSQKMRHNHIWYTPWGILFIPEYVWIKQKNTLIIDPHAEYASLC